MTHLVWFSRDLRLHDNPALVAAVEKGNVLPVFIHAPEEEAPWAPGAASNWWLHHSLKSLEESLLKKGSRLIIKKGPALPVLRDLLRQTGATGVFWNRRYDAAVVSRDVEIKKALTAEGLVAHSFKASLLFEPRGIATKSGGHFQVFTPFWTACLEKGVDRKTIAAPASIPGPTSWPESLPLDALSLEPRIDWAAGFAKVWQPGEEGGRKTLEDFAKSVVRDYRVTRDHPGVSGTSRLSPHIHFGEISPYQIWHALDGRSGSEAYLREIAWREFAHHLLFHFPHTTDRPMREVYGAFPWQVDPTALNAWQKGLTGYPIVDAGMRELWSTGWMHNRVRMIVASFLVKDLLISWKEGARWFWDTLVDADLANNTLGWQWTAGCGADAAPFFRIFNPTLQGEKFDADGNYVRRWVPELAKLPNDFLHKPWKASPEILKQNGIVLGKTYPKPIIDHGLARDRAMAALRSLKKGASHRRD